MDAIPEMVAESGLPEVLLPYQARTVGLLDTVSTKVLCIEKSRRIGLTWGLGSYASLKASRKREARGCDVMYISYNREMTREFIDVCAMWARAFNAACSEVEDTVFVDEHEDGAKSIQAFRITFASGFEIMALSSAPRGLRGKQGVLIIDEAAFVDSLPELLKAGLAFLMWGTGQVIVCSTHDGAENPFNQLIQDVLGGRKPYLHMKIDLDDALRDGLYQRICLVSGQEYSVEAEAEWRDELISFYGDGADEELFCVPSQGSGAWLTAPLIEARMTADAPVLRLQLPDNYLFQDGMQQRALLADFLEELERVLDGLDMDLRYAAGFDFARVADLSVMPVLAIQQDLKRVEAFSIEMRNVPGDEQKMIVKMVLKHLAPRLVGAAFDATGMGWTVAEDMGRIFGLKENPESAGLIWAIKFSETWYRLEMPPLKVAFEDDTLAIGADDDHLVDLRSIKLVRGIPRVPDIRTNEKGEDKAKGKGAKKRHGDYGIGLALAHFASRMQWRDYDYETAKAEIQGHRALSNRLQMNEPEWDDVVRGRNPFSGPVGARMRGGI